MSYRCRDERLAIAAIASPRGIRPPHGVRRVRQSNNVEATGPGPLLADVLERHPDWRERLVRLLDTPVLIVHRACPRGHPLDSDEDLVFRSDRPGGSCRECARASWRRR